MKVTYRREGSGPPLVCHPGGPGFSSHYFGDLAELGERLNLLGHSHGRMVAMAYAAAQPTRVRGLVLAGTTPRFEQEHEAAMIAAMEAEAGEPWYEQARAALEEEQDGDFESDEELEARERFRAEVERWLE